MEIAERRKKQALQKKAEAARVVDAAHKRAERAKTAGRTRKWSRVAVAVQRELHRRQVDSVARVIKEGYWAVIVRRNDSDDEMYKSRRRVSTESDDEVPVYKVRDTESDDEVYEVQDTYEDHWSGFSTFDEYFGDQMRKEREGGYFRAAF